MSDNEALIAKIAGSGATLFAGAMFQALFTFLIRAYLAQSLGNESYGVVTVGISAVVLVSTLGLLGVHRGIGRYIPRLDDSSARGLVFSGIALTAPVVAVLTLLAVVGSERIAAALLGDPSLTPVVLVFAFGLPFAATAEFAIGVAQGRAVSTPKLVVQNLTRPIVMGVGVVTAVELGADIVRVSAGYGAGYVATGAAGLYYLVRLTPSESGPIEWRRRELLVFSVPLIAVTAIRVFFLDLDVLLLSLLAETHEVGVYGGVFPLVKVFGIFLSSFAFISMPIFSQLHETGRVGRMQSLYRTVAKWTFLCTLPLVFVLVAFPRPVIGLTFGPEYQSGAGSLRLLATAYFVHAAAGPNSNAVISIGDTSALARDNLIAASVNLGLNVALIPPFGIEGAATATAIAYVLRNVLVSAHLYRRTGIHPVNRSALGPGVAGSVLAAATSLAAKDLFDGTTALLVAVGAFALTYPLLVVWTGGIGEEEQFLLAQVDERLGLNLSGVVDCLSRHR